MKKLIKANAIKYDKKEDGEVKAVAERIWDAAGGDVDLMIEAFDATIRKHGYISYLIGCLKGEPDNSSHPEDPEPAPQPETVPEPKPEAPNESTEKAKSQDDDPLGNYCFFNRSLRNHPYLKTVPAWVRVMWDNLIMDAAWKDHPITWEPEEGRKYKVDLKRGQWVISERKLAKEHKQSSRMVHHWLENLVKQQMIQCDTLYMKGSSRELFHVAGNGAGNVAGHVARGTIITLLNYNKFQSRFEDDVAALVAANVAANVARTKNVFNKEGNSEDGKLVAVTEKIRSRTIFEVWEKERGPLDPVRAPEYEKLGKLVDYLNSLDGRNPVEAWTEIIHKARQCHQSHRFFMTPYFFSKDLTHIDQVLNGMYDKSFERGKHGATKIERAGRGDAEEFGFKGRSRRRVDTLDDTEVHEV